MAAADESVNPSVCITPQPTNVRRLVFALACGISFLLYLHRYTWGFIKKDVQKEFGWNPVELGFLDGLFGGSYGLAQVPSGMLCDWFGAHVVLGSSIMCWSLALGGAALATGFTSVAMARLLFGVTQAACYPCLTKVSKSWFPVATRTTAQGWIATFFGRAGGAVSFVLFGTVLLGWLGLAWRWATGVFVLLGIACGFLFFLLFRNTPREHAWANQAEADLILAHDPQAAHVRRTALSWQAVLRNRSMCFLCLRAFISNLADVFYVYWVPLYFLSIWKVDVASAGWMAALPLVGGALGGPVSGWLQSRLIARTSRRWARSGVGAGSKVVAAGLMLAAMTCPNAATLACTLLVVKFFTDAEQPVEWGTVTDIAGANSATAFAIVNAVGALGAFASGPLTGIVLQTFGGGGLIPTAAGWDALFVLIACEYVLAAVAWLFVDCRRVISP